MDIERVEAIYGKSASWVGLFSSLAAGLIVIGAASWHAISILDSFSALEALGSLLALCTGFVCLLVGAPLFTNNLVRQGGPRVPRKIVIIKALPFAVCTGIFFIIGVHRVLVEFLMINAVYAGQIVASTDFWRITALNMVLACMLLGVGSYWAGRAIHISTK